MLFDEEYLAHPGLSQSQITLFEKDIRQFYNEVILGIAREEIQSDPMDIGNIVDAKLLTPELLKNYYVVTDMKAGGKMREIIDAVYKSSIKNAVVFNDQPMEWPENVPVLKAKQKITDFPEFMSNNSHLVAALEKAIIAAEWQTNWGMETRIHKVLSSGKDYFAQCVECGDKVMIGLEEWNKAHSKVDAIKEDEYTHKMFNAIFEHVEGVIVHKQLPLYGEFEGVKIKGMLDFAINHADKKVMAPWDLKTARNHWQFLSNYRSKKYGRQGSFYSELIRQNFPGYTLEPFSFLVIPIETDERPEIYEMDATEMYINTHGHTYESGHRLKGWQELLREIEWHKKTGKWDHRKEYYSAGKNIINSKAIVDADLLQVEEKVLF